VSVLLLPLTLVASVFGMNVAFPGFGTREAFWLIVAAMLATVVGLAAFFRYKRWM
jgi:magnesium transporter